MSTYQKIIALRNTPSTNDKIALLKESLDPTLERVFHMALSSEFVFGIRKIPEYRHDTEKMSLRFALDVLEKDFATNAMTGNKRVETFAQLLANLSPDDAEVLKLVVKGTLDCGVSVANANKALTKPIPTFGTMLCAKQDQKLLDALDWNNVVAQCKSDGMRIIISVDNYGNVRYRSRNGREYFFSDKYNNFFKQHPGTVFDGEAVVKIDGIIQNRKTGNGIMNSIRQGKASDQEQDQVHFVLWDSIPYDSFMSGKSDQSYLTRWNNLLSVSRNETVWSPVETCEVKSFDEAQEFYQEMRDRGEEGAIIKDTTATYESKRVKHQIKMKAEETLDLLVTDWIEGTGKNKGLLGAITVTDKSGRLQVNVGSGFDDKDRLMKPEDIVGKIVEIKYNEVIDSKGHDKIKLFLPIFDGIRNDKNEPESL